MVTGSIKIERMVPMHRKFLAIFMTVCLVAALFAGCGGKDKDDPSTKPEISSPSAQENGTAADANAVIPGETQHADGQDGTDQAANGSDSNTANTPGGGSNGTTRKNSSSGQTTAKKPSGGSVTTTTKPSGGGSSDQNSKAEIVSYFNTAANKVKTGKPGLEYSMLLYGKLDMELPSPFNEMFEPISDSSSGSIIKGNNLNNAFPVNGKSWSSQLSPSAVKSASRLLKDGKYTITISMDDEKNVTNFNNSAHGKAFSYIDLTQMEDDQFSVKNMTSNFTGSSISCVIDAATGNMLSAKYTLRDKAKVTLLSEGKEMGPIPMTFEITSSYSMSW